jgi:hypothetical protein
MNVQDVKGDAPAVKLTLLAQAQEVQARFAHFAERPVYALNDEQTDDRLESGSRDVCGSSCCSAYYRTELDDRYAYLFSSRTRVLACALRETCFCPGDAPNFVEVGEVGIAVDDAMRHQRYVQLAW